MTNCLFVLVSNLWKGGSAWIIKTGRQREHVNPIRRRPSYIGRQNPWKEQTQVPFPWIEQEHSGLIKCDDESSIAWMSTTWRERGTVS